MEADSLPLAIVIFTFIGAFTMPFFAHWQPRVCRPMALGVIGADIVAAAYLLWSVFGSPVIHQDAGGWAPPVGIEIIGDPLAAVVLLLISVILFLVLLYAGGAVEREIPPERVGWYYVLVMLCAGGMMGMAVSNDLFNMYVLMEVIGLSACALVVARGTKPSLTAGFKYLMLTTIGSGFLLFGIGLIYSISGHLNITFAVAGILEAEHSDYLIWVVLAFMVVGVAVKSGVFPLHFWLPDAHSTAPTTSSAILSGLVVKMYILLLVRLLYQLYLGGDEQALVLQRFVLLIGAASLLFGSFAALNQLDLKRLLAYSTVAQLGYIFLGLGMMTGAGLVAAFFHIVTHATMKTLLFLSAGNLTGRVSSRKIVDLAGVGRQMPFSAAAFSLAAFSMIGFPLTAGFITKYLLAMAGLEGGSPWPLILVVASGLLNAAYYLPVVVTMFFGGKAQPVKGDGMPLNRLLPLGVLAVGLIVLGLLPLTGYQIFEQAAQALVP